MTGNDIVVKALKCINYVYWYGGKGQKCTTKLLNQLAGLYPSIYTADYIAKCKQDIKDKKTCIDCSGLVCKAYGVDQVGTYSFPKIFKEWSGTPLNGMIVWRWTHTGIYYNGHVIEARGVDYDVTTTRIYRRADWQRIYYKEGVTYMGTHNPLEYLKKAVEVANGNYGNGDARVAKLKAENYDPEKIQAIINEAYKEN